jgi:hypothetical protein
VPPQTTRDRLGQHGVILDDKHTHTPK